MLTDAQWSLIHAAFMRPGMYAGEQGPRSIFQWRKDAGEILLKDFAIRQQDVTDNVQLISKHKRED